MLRNEAVVQGVNEFDCQSSASSFRQGPQNVAILAQYILGQRHLTLEIGIIGGQPIAAVWRFGQENRSPLLTLSRAIASLVRMKPADDPTVVTLNVSMGTPKFCIIHII